MRGPGDPKGLMKDDESHTIIGPSSFVRVGVLIAIIGFGLTTVGGIIGFTWWASGVQSSLNVLLAGQAREIENNNGIRQRVERLELDVATMSRVGSPQAQDLSKRITALENAFELHKGIDKQK